jgi:hypothetical protein
MTLFRRKSRRYQARDEIGLTGVIHDVAIERHMRNVVVRVSNESVERRS